MSETELERAEKRYAQAKARLTALRNRAATAARKMDTRRKVILGGALVNLASRDDGAARLLDRLVRNLPREQDRKAFVGWTPGDALPESGDAIEEEDTQDAARLGDGSTLGARGGADLDARPSTSPATSVETGPTPEGTLPPSPEPASGGTWKTRRGRARLLGLAPKD